ncbi:hypothetical protein KPL70_008918 [Citrus sinensis]|nr:hypothetical protein KPL70_008918 [Citrus sinensis]
MKKALKEDEASSERNNERVIIEGAWQMWHRNGTRCPKGTVPIRRSTEHDVLRAKSLFDFGKKQHRRIPLHRRADAPDVVSGNGHEHAIAYTGSSQEVYGARATINVWDPSIQVVNEFSLSQIWVLSGSFDGSDLNSIEAGWQVSPELYGDSRPRLFTYWTSDSYQATGCYNLLCAGFIQTNSRIAIGAAISPISTYAGNQFDITILIWKDPKLGNWWMGFGENLLVGYWPAELFTHLADHATMVEWGGEVVNSRANGEHTATQMGSGHFAEDGFGKASYFRNLEMVDSDNSLSSDTLDKRVEKGPKCGAFCVTAFIDGEDVVVSNLGNCKGLLCRDGVAETLAPPHNVYNLDERKRIVDKVVMNLQIDLSTNLDECRNVTDGNVVNENTVDDKDGKNLEPYTRLEFDTQDDAYFFYLKHVLCVLQSLGVFNIQPHYVLKRWSKDAKSFDSSSSTSNIPKGIQFKKQLFDKLFHQAIKLGEEGLMSSESFNIAYCALQDALEKCTRVNRSLKEY